MGMTYLLWGFCVFSVLFPILLAFGPEKWVDKLCPKNFRERTYFDPF